MSVVARLGGPDFVRLWAASSVSFLGTAVTSVALPFVALVSLHATTFEAGLISAAGVAAWLFLGLSAGVWTERMTRRPLLIVCDLIRALALVSIPVAYALGWLTIAHLVVVALVIGVGSVFFDIATQAYLPSVIGKPELLAGNSKLQTTEAAARTGGPALGGVLVSLIGAPLTLVVDVVSYLFSAVSLATVRRREPPIASPEKRRMWPQIKEGLRYVLADPVLRPLTMVAASLNFLGAALDTVVVPFLLRDVGMSPAVIGFLIAAGGVGGVVGAAIGGRFAQWAGSARALMIAALAGAPLALLIPLTSMGAAISLFLVGFVGREIFIAVFSLLARTYRQMSAPGELLARVTASIKFLSWGVLPLGALIGGGLGQLVGNRAALWIVCIGLVLTPLPLLLSPLRGLRDLDSDLTSRADSASRPLTSKVDPQ